MRNRTVSLFAALAVAGLAGTAGAASTGLGVQGQMTVGITGFVPVICRAAVDVGSVSTTPGTKPLGVMKEFCNAPGGYRVVANYSPGLADAKIIVDGKPIALDASGSTVVSRSNRAGINERQLELELADSTAGGNISFRIEHN